MTTCQSPRRVMLVAYRLAQQCLPDHSSKFSRHDFTLAQLFACLICKELLGLSYRRLEAFLRDVPEWCAQIGMHKSPDHNTLHRAAQLLLGQCKVRRLLDEMTRWLVDTRSLKLDQKPLAIDCSFYEDRHVSRYFEFRRGRGTGKKG